MWDLFISHASEDKDFVRPLANELQYRGLTVWYDEFSLKLGDSLREKIDEGLAQSSYGVVVLSKHFFEKDWPRRELDGLVAREMDGAKVILPIWHGVTKADVIRFSPPLAGVVAANTSIGLPAIVDRVMQVVRPNTSMDFLDIGGSPAWIHLLEFQTSERLKQVVNSPQFLSRYPEDMPPSQFVDKLCDALSKNPPVGMRNAWVSLLTNGTATRAQILRAIQESKG